MQDDTAFMHVFERYATIASMLALGSLCVGLATFVKLSRRGSR
jgi:hypothetical protein